MVKKKNIGCFQFWIGIVLLVVAIIGLIFFILALNNLKDAKDVALESNEDYYDWVTESDKVNFVYAQAILKVEGVSTALSLAQSVALATIIIFLMSILFITQGLANKSGVKK